MKTTTYLAAATAAFLAATSAQASTILGAYDVTPAVSTGSAQAQSLWFKEILGTGLTTVYTLTSPGSLVATATGAVLTGSTVNENSATNAGFDLSFTFDRDFSDLPITSPVFKDVFGDTTNPNAVEHGNEDYLDLESGVITGTGYFDGLIFTVTRAPADGEFATQVGGGILSQIGANQHNSNYGMSGWFTIASVDSANCANCDQDEFQKFVGMQGDINFDLTPAAVPLPAAGFLLLSALGAAAGVSARKRRS